MSCPLCGHNDFMYLTTNFNLKGHTENDPKTVKMFYTIKHGQIVLLKGYAIRKEETRIVDLKSPENKFVLKRFIDSLKKLHKIN